MILVGCQGLSAGKSADQDPGLLDFGSASLDFGKVAAGSSKTLTITATNSESQTVTISSATITTKYFSLVGPSLPVTIAAGQSANLSFTFSPDTISSFSATASITTDATNAVTNISLTGTGAANSDGQLALTPGSDAFGNVVVGGMQSQTVTLTNNGSGAVNISQASVSGTGFKLTGISAPMTLNPSQSTNFTVSFAPQTTGNTSGTVTILSNGPNPTLTMALTGSGVSPSPLSSSPASLSFGTVPIGTKQNLSETLTNTGSSNITISQVAIAGGSGFSMSGITAPTTVPAGQSVAFSVSFDPTASAAVTGTVTITSDASDPVLTISLSGSGATAGPLVASPASLSFGNVALGSKQTLSETVTNNGGSSVTISQVDITGGSGFSMSGLTSPVTLTSGQSTTFSVSFAPTSAGTVTGSVILTSNAVNSPLTISLSGSGATAGPLAASPSSVSFGSVPVGTTKTLSETVTNSGGSSVTVSQVAITGGSGFSMSGITAPLTIPAGQSTTFSVSLDPTATGAVSGSITITSSATNSPLTIALSGTGAASGAMTSNPTSLSFGSVQVGVKQTLSETVTNSGGSSVTISQAAITGSGFAMTGIATPLTLTAGQSATFSVSFTPSAAGAGSGSITITSNASNPTLTIPLSGTGITAGALGSNPTSLSFGSVQVGVKQTLSETITNSGGSSVTISQAAVTGSGFAMTGIATPLTLTAGQSATFSVSFTPSAAGAASGSVTITSNASNPSLTILLSGTGLAAGALGSNPSSLSFGSVQVGVKQTLSETVTNSGGSSVTISQAAITGTGFAMTGITTPLTLTAGQSATFSVSFTPSTTGAASGSVSITSNASNPTLTIPLSGTGVSAGTLGSNPTSLSFGNVQVGVKQTLSETVTNSGGSSVTISQVGVAGTGFNFSGIATPLTLTAGQSATFSVSFTPSVAGAASGTVTITSNASNPTLTVPLSGTGVSAGGLASNPTSLSFGSVQIGVKQTLSESVTNSGGSSVTISQATISGTGFSMTGITTPLTLTAGQTATFNVSFTPSAAGAASGNVIITSNASNPTLTVPFSGTGVSAGALGSNPTSLSFGSVEVGDKQNQLETLTNGGGSSIVISQIAITGAGFSFTPVTTPLTLTSGQSISFNVSFNPATAGAVSGNLTVTSNATNPTLTVPLSGTGLAQGTVVTNPTTLSFGSVPVGTKQTLSETIKNAGGASVTISQVSVTGSGFGVTGITTPITLTSGQSASFSVSFTPQSAGSVNGDVFITSDASDPTLAVPLSGTGTSAAAGQLSVSPTTLALGSVAIGNSGTGTGTLTASGSSVTVSSLSSTNAAFSVSGLSLPVTIPAGQSVSFTVTFTPQATGSATGTLTFSSNAQPSTTAETVTGTGTAAATHTVSLSWNASTSSDVSGYNIYRAVYTTSCGSFLKINSTLNASMTYTDSTVANSTSYCYAATTVDSTNTESGYSNIVSNLQVP